MISTLAKSLCCQGGDSRCPGDAYAGAQIGAYAGAQIGAYAGAQIGAQVLRLVGHHLNTFPSHPPCLPTLPALSGAHWL